MTKTPDQLLPHVAGLICYLCPRPCVVASVSASHAIVEIGNAPRVAIGDVATVFDAQDGSRPEDLAASCNSSVYDLTMHLHALLPRKMM